VSAAIEISQLRKSYDGVTVIDGLDLAVERGEIFALLGPNGAGKTTTVEICEGFRRADGGRVAVLDTDPRRASAHWRSRIGIVAQQTTDFEDVTVAEAVDIVAGLFLRPRPPAAVIDAVGLTEYRNVRGSKLSGGLRRRLDVASASSAIRSCCSWTSRRPASIPSRAGSSGNSSVGSTSPARRSC
jgi:ABC-2 type transport system ATP-binding protein